MNGIYSFYPRLSSIAYSYKFNSQQMISAINEEAQSYIDKADISQFSGNDDKNEKKYVICIVNRIIYVLTEKGEVLFYQDISQNIKDTYNPISLVAYKYLDGIYYFTVGFNTPTTFDTYLYYFKIIFQSEATGSIILIRENNSKITYEGTRYYINSDNISCEKMVSYTNNNFLVCFVLIIEIKDGVSAFYLSLMINLT